MFTYQALNVLIFLFPGVVCMAVLDMLTPASKRDNLQRIVQALMYSFVIYAFFAIAFGESPVFLVEESIGTAKQFSVNFAKGSLAFLLAVSVLTLQRHLLLISIVSELFLLMRKICSMIFYLNPYYQINHGFAVKYFHW